MAEPRLELLMTAWGIICNTDEGNWENQTEEWQTAAKNFRDDFHEHLSESIQGG